MRRTFYTGLAFGIVPVYVSLDSEEMMARNWVGDFVLDWFFLPMCDAYAAFRTWSDAEYEPEGFPIMVTGEVEIELD